MPKTRSLLSYLIILLFLSWCAVAFRHDLAQIRLEPVWTARYAVLLAAGLSLFNYCLRIVRWSLYLKRLKHPLPLGFTALTYLAGFAFTLSPGKVGEMLRGRYYQQHGIPLANSAAAFFIERLMDLLAMLALACLALASYAAYQHILWVTAACLVAAMLLLAVTPWQRLSNYLAQSKYLPLKLQNPFLGIFRTLTAARALLHPGVLLTGFLLALVAWGAEGIGLLSISQMFPKLIMPWNTAISIYAIAVIVGAISFLPGGLGSTEAVMIALLHNQGYALPDAILLTVVCRLLTLWFAVGIGWIAVLLLRRTTPISGR